MFSRDGTRLAFVGCVEDYAEHHVNGQHSPLAIIGLACRFPGGLEDIDTLWQALRSKFSAIDTVPSDRWAVDRYYSSHEAAKGKSYMRRGGFLRQDLSGFDATFFGISPRDAENMDPQQRLLLETVWESFENAGLSAPAHAGRAVGVYVGGFMLDHMITQMTPSNRSQINQHTAAGMMMTMLSNRVSHTFDFRGPSLSIDTACSSSLVAFHYACQDLWRGACELAVIGGANTILRPEYPMGMCKGHFLSRDGECKSFDARGDGYGRGEGAAAVLVKPLAAALAAGDPILATVVGTGTNQDGRTPGISLPSFAAQKALIAEVCEKYAIDPREVRYVECHGTGTAAGDPIEARAVGETYGAARRDVGPVVIGSIKSGIGHLEAAAGVAGVIKAALTAAHRSATPLANLQTPNPAIPLAELNVRLADDNLPLGAEDEDFCIAINSFGYGGSNAHVVLRTPPSREHKPGTNGHGRPPALRNFPYFLPLSGRSNEAVTALAGKYAELLDGPASLEDVLHSASLKRAHLSHRAVVKGNSREDLRASLDLLVRGEECLDVVRDVEPYAGLRKPVFVFTGMGPQWWGMGQELYAECEIYRAAVREADAVWQTIAGESILAEMLQPEAKSLITRTIYAQPANLVLQIGLLAVLKAAGIEPAAVVGHSVGELASAYAAGVLSLHDALTVSFHRSRLQATCAGTGGMLAVGLSAEKAQALLVGREDRVSIAAVNGPANVTLAGDEDELLAIASHLSRTEVFHRALDVEVPYHSPQMEPIMAELAAALADVQPNPPQLPLYSTVTGERVEGVSYGADYWPQNIRRPVLFANAIRALLAEGCNTFLEVGPHPVLGTSLKECFKEAGKDCRNLFLLRRHSPESAHLHRGIMSVFAAGCELDWKRHNAAGKFITLPNYAWQRQKFWLENDRAVQDRINPIRHPLLGTQEAPGSPVWRNDFDHEPLLYLRDHVVAGMPILPAAGYLETLLELAAVQFSDAAGWAVRNLSIYAPMIITVDRGLDCVTSYDPVSQAAVIRSLENGKLGGGQTHVTARLAAVRRRSPRTLDLAALRAECTQSTAPSEFYARLQPLGLQYGSAFQAVKELHTPPSGGKALARIETPAFDNLAEYVLHPSLLDACFQSLVALVDSTEHSFLPTGLEELCVYTRQSPQNVWCAAEIKSRGERRIDCDLTLVDDAGTTLATIRGLRLSAAAKRERTDRFGDRVKRQILCYDWTYGEILNEPKRLGHWLVVGGADELTYRVTSRLEDYGVTIVARASFGESFAADANSFTLRSGSRDDAAAMLASAGQLDGVLLLHGLSATPASDDPTGEQATAGLIGIAQALADRKDTPPPRVYVVTQGAFSVREGDAVANPAQTALNGFARVAFNELEGLKFSTIDLPADCTADDAETLTLELLCDDAHDETAIRQGLRLVSELVDSKILSDDRIAYARLDDANPVLVRPLRADTECVGTARVLAAATSAIGASDIRVRIEATHVPTALLAAPNSDTLQQPCIEIVGCVLDVGANVTDLAPGERVAGFAVADLASHFVGPRDAFHLARIAEDVAAAAVVSGLGPSVRAERALAGLDLVAGDTAAVRYSPFGLALAEGLRRRGVQVAILHDDPAALESPALADFPIYACCPEGIELALREQTRGAGFGVLAAGMSGWTEEFDFSLVQPGGALIDTDEVSMPLTAPAHIHDVVRTDFRVLLAKPRLLATTLANVVRQLASGELAPPPYLEVSLADLAWRKLPLTDTRSTLVLNYNTRGQDLPVVQRDELQFLAEATYLITGGFGGLGRKTAEWLVANGARHLILTGRTGADSTDKRAFVAALEAAGAHVRAVACDTADLQRLREVFAEIAREMPPLKGVFHSGAVILDQPIAEIELNTYRQVMAGKALGAWNLHQLTRDLPLDHFVLYSSLANLVGNSRQGAYSAANGFLNGLAHYRRALGLAATAVNWGAIADVGVVAQDEKLEQFLRYTGLRGIQSAEALDVLRQALARDVTQFGVTVISSWSDWARFETRGALSPRFASLIAADSKQEDHSLRDAIVQELQQLEPADRVELLCKLMVEIVASVLKSSPDNVPIDRAVSLLGVDSLMATEIQLMLDNSLGISVSIMELIGDTTIRSLAANSVKKLCGEEDVPAAV